MSGFRIVVVVVAIFGLGWGASFGAGMAAGARRLPSLPAQAAGSARPAGEQAGSASPGASRAQVLQALQGQEGSPGQRSAISGMVERLEGNVLVLSGPSGSMRVAIGDQTAIVKTAPGARADLVAGVRVTVMGQPGPDGAVLAQMVQLGDGALPPGQAGGEPGQRPRAGR
jgi:hypothetical protein